MAAQQKQGHRNLIKKYNLHFDGPVDRDQWPSAHFHTFKNIQTLGRTEFTDYRESVSVDSQNKPWREQTKRRAERIANLARICRDGRKNEAGWRMSLESEVLARFTIEVACPACRARLWRSELEVTASSLDKFSESLEERRKKRSPCTCRPGRRGGEAIEQGVNTLFDDRAQEAIVQDATLESAMQKKEEPDRVYGLRMTKRLERLLQWTEDKRPSAGGKMIGDSIQCTPFRPDGEPIVFPFLALEAKSEKGRDSWTDIETQTAFTIYSLLTLQEDLRAAAGGDSDWESGPLVWFLANKGEQWRVAAAYVEHKNGSRHHRIIDLWEGRILSTDGAIQLLLIVDYIFDWARDVYREAIIGELRNLAANNTSSLGKDSDIFSLEDRVAFWPQLPLNQEPPEGQDSFPPEADDSSRASTQDLLEAFDSPHGVIRDPSYICDRFMALYITEDNLSVLMASMKTPDKARRAAENILRFLKDSWRVSREALDEIEHKWTGMDRENMSLYSPKKVFLVTTTVSAYISPDWEQTRELCLLAVSADVVQELFEYAKLENSEHWQPSDSPWLEDDAYVSTFGVYLSMGVSDNLLAAMSRASVSTKLFTEKTKSKTTEGLEHGTWWATSSEDIGGLGGITYRFDAAIMPDSQAHARGFVSSIYNLHKVGRNEPSSSILRISSKIGQHQRPAEIATKSMWPGLFLPEPFTVQGHIAVYVTSKNPSNVNKYAEFCIYVLDMSKIDQIISQHTPEQIDMAFKFQAKRLDTKAGWGGGWNRTDVQSPDPNFSDNRKKLIGHLMELQSFANFRKGKTVDFIKPSKSWKPKKTNTSWDLIMEPQSYKGILRFRDMMVAQGSRVTAITNRHKKFLEPGAVKPPMLGASSILGIVPNFIEGPGSTLEVYPRPEPTIGKSVDRTSEGLDAGDHEKLQEPEEEGDNSSVNFSAPRASPTKSQRDRVTKRFFDDSDLGTASSSAGPSKRPREEAESQFDSDFLDDDAFMKLLGNGGFAE